MIFFSIRKSQTKNKITAKVAQLSYLSNLRMFPPKLFIFFQKFDQFWVFGLLTGVVDF